MGRPMYPRAGIKSIQRGTIAVAATSAVITVAEVDPAKSILTMLGWSSSLGTAPMGYAPPRLNLTSSTEIEIRRITNAANIGTATASWELVEWK